jgi:hypothetical protein
LWIASIDFDVIGFGNYFQHSIGELAQLRMDKHDLAMPDALQQHDPLAVWVESAPNDLVAVHSPSACTRLGTILQHA